MTANPATLNLEENDTLRFIADVEPNTIGLAVHVTEGRPFDIIGEFDGEKSEGYGLDFADSGSLQIRDFNDNTVAPLISKGGGSHDFGTLLWDRGDSNLHPTNPQAQGSINNASNFDDRKFLRPSMSFYDWEWVAILATNLHPDDSLAPNWNLVRISTWGSTSQTEANAFTRYFREFSTTGSPPVTVADNFGWHHYRIRKFSATHFAGSSASPGNPFNFEVRQLVGIERRSS